MTPYTHQSAFLATTAGPAAATTTSPDVDMMPIDDHHDAASSSINLADLGHTLPTSAPATSSTMPCANPWLANPAFAGEPNPSPFAGGTGTAAAYAIRQPSKRRTRDDDNESPVLPKMVRDGTRKPRRVTTEEVHSRTLEKLFRAARSSTPNGPASASNAPTCSSSLSLPKPTLLLVPAACAHCHAVITSLIEALPNELPLAPAAHLQQPQQHLAIPASTCAAGIGSHSHSQSMHGAGAKCTSCDRQYCVPCMRSCDRCDEPTCIECYMTLYDDRGQQTVCWTCGHHQ